MSKQEEDIAFLNAVVNVRIGPSNIHGVGIFAIQDIPKGRKLALDAYPQAYRIPYSSFSKFFPVVRDLLLERWPQIVNGSAFMYPDTRLQAYCNHSDDPNYDGINDIALKDIKVGEEITENYRLIPGHEVVHSFLDNKIKRTKKTVV